MAADSKPHATKGGNTPKPVSAKDRSRHQSRPVAGKGGAPGARGLSGTVMAWGAVGLVIVVIAVLVIVKETGGSNPSKAVPVTPAPASIVHDITSIPPSVFNNVGVTASSAAQVSTPSVITGQPAMSLGGHSPAMLYLGAEFCPYCAAERWAVVAALSRFGTWSGLQITASSPTDGDIRTFSFRTAAFASKYITFQAIEECTNIADPSNTGCHGYTNLQTPTKDQQAVLDKYAAPPYTQSSQIGFPYMDIDNTLIFNGATYQPVILSGLSWQQIASVLTDPTNTVTQGIVAAANIISAGVCASDGQKPSNVCSSPGVKAAIKALKL